ncbi:hypothetical protein [Paenarthrobacter nitroguajacolicus]|uniref:hypothetical protein n=1 Tax=Paenarthrobacter nitroguajacolicus TaxID=211146 RepID=UPI0015C15381|nr:hypothetical protein [Paenarthrobacter nitroguajacolicus]NWL34252.1 hypothetical protein [Paenarthrobacter nitroguajacolicus]
MNWKRLRYAVRRNVEHALVLFIVNDTTLGLGYPVLVVDLDDLSPGPSAAAQANSGVVITT